MAANATHVAMKFCRKTTAFLAVRLLATFASDTAVQKARRMMPGSSRRDVEKCYRYTAVAVARQSAD